MKQTKIDKRRKIFAVPCNFKNLWLQLIEVPIILLLLLLLLFFMPRVRAAVVTGLLPYSASYPGWSTYDRLDDVLDRGDGEIPRMVSSYAAFKNKLGISWDKEFLYIESNGLPDHGMMKGITAWQQQVPIPHDYTGDNSFKLPLQPRYLEDSDKLPILGPIALAVNGVPIFQALTQSGRDAYLGGELDEWGGHCGRADDYHYHIAPAHLESEVGKGNPVAFGLDGYPIYLANPSKDKKLDECHGYFDDEGKYRYVANLKPPYIMARFRGAAKLESRPATRGIRPHLQPLHGAEIYGFKGSLEEGFALFYTADGKRGSVQYEVKGADQVDFIFNGIDGKVSHQTYARRSDDGRGRSSGEHREVGQKESRESTSSEGGAGKFDGSKKPRQEKREKHKGALPGPLAEILDVNRDGVIDSEEIANAVEQLKKLDVNGDGELSREEAIGKKGGKKGGKDGKEKAP